MCKYYIEQWGKTRRNEMPDIVADYKVHPCFLQKLSEYEFKATFEQIWEIIYNIYDDIVKDPNKFSMPIFSLAENGYNSPGSSKSRQAPWLPIDLINYIMLAGDIQENLLIVNVNKLKQINKVKNMHLYLKPLTEYGFQFGGLENYKIPKNGKEFWVEYPDNPNVLEVLKLVAEKAKLTGRSLKIPNRWSDDFVTWNYRILKDDFETINYGKELDVIVDRMHKKDDIDFIYAFDQLMKKKEYYSALGGMNEGPGYFYYDTESKMKRRGPYLFLLMCDKAELKLYLRIRNVESCREVLKTAPETVKMMFRQSDKGCKNRFNGCTKGVSYDFDGQTYWRCGCCGAPFQVKPLIEDISYYEKLVDAGSKK